MNTSASAIALRRLTRANALFIEIVTGLYDDQASKWPVITAPSPKWHLWHISRWSDIVQSTLLPVANGESDLSNKGAQLWEALGIADEWGLAISMPGKLGGGTGLTNAEASTLGLPDLTRVVGYPRSSFELCEMRFAQIDEGLFESDFYDWDGVRMQVGDAMFGHISHINRHLGMIEAIKGVLGLNGSVTD
ncbi:MAG: DinB family protein [Chloroflexi bacterium]|nr:DinB family protein [Chloroflexota bacterium]